MGMNQINSHSANVGLIERYLGTAYDDIMWMKSNISDLRQITIDLANLLSIQADVTAKRDEVLAFATLLDGIAKMSVPVGSIYDMSGMVGASGDSILVRDYFSGSGDGGGLFVFYPDLPKSLHDGGLYISSTVPALASTITHIDWLNGVGETDPAGAGVWMRVNVGALLPEFYGASTANQIPSTLPLTWTIARSKELHKPIVGFRSYITEGVLDFRGCNCYMLGNIHTVSGGIGVRTGTVPGQDISFKQVFNSFTSSHVADHDDPNLLITGVNRGELHIEACPVLVIESKANIPVSTSKFFLKDIGHLYLETNDNTATAFIYNNEFDIGIIDSITLQGLTGGICNNNFRNLYIPSAGGIEIIKGSNNSFTGIRYNPMTVEVKFGQDSRFNNVEGSYLCEGTFLVTPILDVIDFGEGNIVSTKSRDLTEPVTITSLDISDVRLNTMAFYEARVQPCLNYLRGYGGAGVIEDLLISNFVRADANDTFLMQVFGDGALRYGYSMMCFDRNKQPMPPNIAYLLSLEINSAGLGRMNSVSGIEKASFTLTPAAISAGVRFIRMSIISTGHALTATAMSIVRFTAGESAPVPKMYNQGVHGQPTQGFAPQGYRAHDISGDREYTCSFSLRTGIAQAVNPSSISATLLVTDGVIVGDVVGLSLDSGETHWTVVTAISGGVLQTAAAPPSVASAGNEAVFVRWVAR